jgi:chromosome partitioning protein
MDTTVITIANWKGGVGKSSSAASIGAALAMKGRRMLLIDLDAQQNLSFMMGHNEDPENT